LVSAGFAIVAPSAALLAAESGPCSRVVAGWAGAFPRADACCGVAVLVVGVTCSAACVTGTDFFAAAPLDAFAGAFAGVAFFVAFAALALSAFAGADFVTLAAAAVLAAPAVLAAAAVLAPAVLAPDFAGGDLAADFAGAAFAADFAGADVAAAFFAAAFFAGAFVAGAALATVDFAAVDFAAVDLAAVGVAALAGAAFVAADLAALAAADFAGAAFFAGAAADFSALDLVAADADFAIFAVVTLLADLAAGTTRLDRGASPAPGVPFSILGARPRPEGVGASATTVGPPDLVAFRMAPARSAMTVPHMQKRARGGAPRTPEAGKNTEPVGFRQTCHTYADHFGQLRNSPSRRADQRVCPLHDHIEPRRVRRT
jgi:hypothetical protein